jgi:hypothetical protein
MHKNSYDWQSKIRDSHRKGSPSSIIATTTQLCQILKPVLPNVLFHQQFGKVTHLFGAIAQETSPSRLMSLVCIEHSSTNNNGTTRQWISQKTTLQVTKSHLTFCLKVQVSDKTSTDLTAKYGTCRYYNARLHFTQDSLTKNWKRYPITTLVFVPAQRGIESMVLNWQDSNNAWPLVKRFPRGLQGPISISTNNTDLPCKHHQGLLYVQLCAYGSRCPPQSTCTKTMITMKVATVTWK